MIDFNRQVSEIQKKKVYGGRQGYSCQAQFNETGLAMLRLYIVIVTSNVTTDAERNIGHTNPANLAKEREMSCSSVYL